MSKDRSGVGKKEVAVTRVLFALDETLLPGEVWKVTEGPLILRHGPNGYVRVTCRSWHLDAFVECWVRSGRTSGGVVGLKLWERLDTIYRIPFLVEYSTEGKALIRSTQPDLDFLGAIHDQRLAIQQLSHMER